MGYFYVILAFCDTASERWSGRILIICNMYSFSFAFALHVYHNGCKSLEIHAFASIVDYLYGVCLVTSSFTLPLARRLKMS